MSVQIIESGARLPDAGALVIAVTVREEAGGLGKLLRSLGLHAPPHVPVLLWGPGAHTAVNHEVVREIAESRAIYVIADGASDINTALVTTDPADLVCIDSDCVVAARWLETMESVVAEDGRIASVTTAVMPWMPTAGSGGEAGSPRDLTLDHAAMLLLQQSPALHPEVPAMGGHCVYIRRRAVSLAGPVDGGFAPGDCVAPQFSEESVKRGLRHVLADEVLIQASATSPRESQSPVALDGPLRLMRDQTHPEESNPDESRLRRALAATERSLRKLRVAIDARALDGPMNGTQIQIMAFVRAVSELDQTDTIVVLPDHPHRDATEIFQSLPAKCVQAGDEAEKAVADADLLHRPCQLRGPADLRLADVARRFVITQQDMIGYHNPSYYENEDRWTAYRRLTRLALESADHVVFPSQHALADAARADLVTAQRASVVRLGVDHFTGSGAPVAVIPRVADRLVGGRQLMLCIGADYHHKNRLFVLRLVQELREHHGWPGIVAFAGPSVTYGSSRIGEREFLSRNPDLSDAVIDCGPVTEEEKRWLLGQTTLVVYPSVDEGFGLVPFEAASYGVPCLWNGEGALSEVLPADIAGIDAWDARQTATRAADLLSSPGSRAALIGEVRRAADRLTWQDATKQIVNLYVTVCNGPRAGSAGGSTPAHDGMLSEDALRLVGPAGELPRDMERPLLALATHPSVGRPIFQAMAYCYRIGRKLRQAGFGR